MQQTPAFVVGLPTFCPHLVNGVHQQSAQNPAIFAHSGGSHRKSEPLNSASYGCSASWTTKSWREIFAPMAAAQKVTTVVDNDEADAPAGLETHGLRNVIMRCSTSCV